MLHQALTFSKARLAADRPIFLAAQAPPNYIDLSLLKLRRLLSSQRRAARFYGQASFFVSVLASVLQKF
jgi:hypothetical protein